MNVRRVASILKRAREAAAEYYVETGKPLGITSEVAEFEAARRLGLELCEARQPGFDAVRTGGDGPKRVQIKGRCIQDGSKGSQKVGGFRRGKNWDSVVLVPLNSKYRPTAIYEARRRLIEVALNSPGSKARTERRQLPISKLKSLGRCVWP